MATTHDARHAYAELIRKMFSAFERGDAKRAGEFIHPDAQLQSIAGGVALGPAGVVAYVQATKRRLVRVTLATVEQRDDAVLLVGRIQHQSANGSLSDRPAAWVMRFRDGLVWRGTGFTNQADARAAWESAAASNDPA
jgi:ketosteroid isomerase-like protein